MYYQNRYWLGEPVEKAVMLEHFSRAFVDTVPENFYYAHTYTDENRSAESLYTLRICLFESSGEPPQIHAAFDGVPSVRQIRSGDILLGSYNGGNQVLNSASTVYGGVSVIFHTHHIRLHYCRYEYGKAVENIYYYAPAASGVLLHEAKALDALIHAPGPGRDERCRILLNALVMQLEYELRQMPEDEVCTNPLAQKLKYCIEQNFYRMVNCSGICEELKLNRSYASKLFHDTYGVTMNRYLLDLRLEAAVKLLESQENVKIADIARQCAFADPGYFIRLFRQRFNCTPGEFRHGNRNR